ncbi:hypothetical protein EYF80_017275 [Liparis tanakae]|uniref:Uncharacterized protein n=1 Tax=Liparis tanakae TaxID=230148 RepID=A0A4Z2I363_9TELE|nr:hypothetical protein EYF80_017275 [Liparis tanakae]
MQQIVLTRGVKMIQKDGGTISCAYLRLPHLGGYLTERVNVRLHCSPEVSCCSVTVHPCS